ncbi:MAG: hypothetical protein RJA70_1268 [Pseudomonadota bacterium]
MKNLIIILGCALASAACQSDPKASETAVTDRSERDRNANTTGNARVNEAADNTGINVRDRQGTVTPGDQGSSEAETEVTAAIRRGITDTDSLSFTAKNAKVITQGERVTLRGPVESAQEKSTIEAIAKRTAGVSAVDNQLEVKN